jgi:hypothetical protein
MTRHPDVTVSIPSVITADPDISDMRGRARMFHYDRGRSNADNNLRKRRHSSKRTSNNSNERDFLHGVSLFSSVLYSELVNAHDCIL